LMRKLQPVNQEFRFIVRRGSSKVGDKSHGTESNIVYVQNADYRRSITIIDRVELEPSASPVSKESPPSFKWQITMRVVSQPLFIERALVSHEKGFFENTKDCLAGQSVVQDVLVNTQKPPEYFKMDSKW